MYGAVIWSNSALDCSKKEEAEMWLFDYSGSPPTSDSEEGQ